VAGGLRLAAGGWWLAGLVTSLLRKIATSHDPYAARSLRRTIATSQDRKIKKGRSPCPALE
jgi:hypothetical protein